MIHNCDLIKIKAAGDNLREQYKNDLPVRNYEILMEQINSGKFPLGYLAGAGLGGKETIYTMLLGRFLKPYQVSPRGTFPNTSFNLLKYLVFAALSSSQGNNEDMKNAFLAGEGITVHPEAWLGTIKVQGVSNPKGCIVDVQVISEKFVTLIEGKIWTGESKKNNISQLVRYDEAIKQNFASEWKGKKITKIYLTPNGNEPNSSDWEPLSYKQFVHKILSKLKDNKNIVPDTELLQLFFYLADIIEGPLLFDERAKRQFLKAMGHGVNVGALTHLRKVVPGIDCAAELASLMEDRSW